MKIDSTAYSGAPGDFENAGFLGVPNGYVKAPAGTREKKLAAEIANGRLAMMAIIGIPDATSLITHLSCGFNVGHSCRKCSFCDAASLHSFSLHVGNFN